MKRNSLATAGIGGSLRILITNNHLVRMGGTETWVLTMVKELARDHELFVFTHQKGVVSDLLKPYLTDNPPICDLALINHRSCMHLEAHVKVFTSHGAFHELEQPIEGADFYVAVSEEIARKYGIGRIIRNPIDTKALLPTTPIAAQPRKALAIVSDSAFPVIREACSRLGIEVVRPTREKFSIPELANQVDLVFSLGRGALEAMSCGRPVIIFDDRDYTQGADGYLNDFSVRECNYSGRYFGRKFDVDGLVEEILKFDPADGAANRDYVVKHHDVVRIADSYLALHAHHAALRRAPGRVEALAERTPESPDNRVASVILDASGCSRLPAEAIESVLNQRHPNVELVLVVSGRNRTVLDELGDRSGQLRCVVVDDERPASRLEAGLAASRGEIVLFLDGADRLLSKAISSAAEALRNPALVKVHWPVRFVNPSGGAASKILPRHLPAGDVSARARLEGPLAFASPPLSGSAWRRSALRRAFPIPGSGDAVGVDVFLSELAPLLGPLAKIIEPQADRLASPNLPFSAASLQAELDHRIEQQVSLFEALGPAFQSLGVAVDPQGWRRESWSYRILLSIRDIAHHIPAGSEFILVDEDQIACDEDHAQRDFGGRKPVPFISRNGQYWGPPADDAEALFELRRMAEGGVRYLAVAWPAFWWLDHYSHFHDHLRACHRCVVENERLVLFKLLGGAASNGGEGVGDNHR